MSLSNQGPEAAGQHDQAGGVAETPEPQYSAEELEAAEYEMAEMFRFRMTYVADLLFCLSYLIYAQAGDIDLTPSGFREEFAHLDNKMRVLRAVVMGDYPTPCQETAFQNVLKDTFGATYAGYVSLMEARAELCGEPR